MGDEEVNTSEQKENFRRDAILSYGLYIMSFTTNKLGNELKFHEAQKRAFALGLMSKNDVDLPFQKIEELHEWFLMGRASIENITNKSIDTICN